MSHEGIRILSPEESERLERASRPLPQAATAPAKVTVAVTDGTGVRILWKDGHRSEWTFAYLRHACPCAVCHEERERTGRAPGAAPTKAKELLPLYVPPPSPVSAEPVGRYALKFKWADGHESGLYSWDFLRRLDEGLLR